jgi:hypothetical protein
MGARVAPVVCKITPRHGPHGKRSLHCWDVLEQFPSNRRGTDLQKTSYVIAILPAYWRADCCLATSNNMRNSIVACVYSVARCLSVRCLAIYVTIYCAWGKRNSYTVLVEMPERKKSLRFLGVSGMIILWRIWRYFRYERCYSTVGYGFGDSYATIFQIHGTNLTVKNS